MERLSALLDEDGDGRVSYRSLLGMLAEHLGDWVKRLPEVRTLQFVKTGLYSAPSRVDDFLGLLS